MNVKKLNFKEFLEEQLIPFEEFKRHTETFQEHGIKEYFNKTEPQYWIIRAFGWHNREGTSFGFVNQKWQQEVVKTTLEVTSGYQEYSLGDLYER